MSERLFPELVRLLEILCVRETGFFKISCGTALQDSLTPAR
jgi:hypothetical protein